MRTGILGNTNNRAGTIFMLQTIAISSSNFSFKTGLRLASSMMTIHLPTELYPYKPPKFARHFKNVPKYKLKLANLPTPLQRIGLSGCNSTSSTYHDGRRGGILQSLRDLNIDLIIKRDDATAGTELGGNKVRKLEFLLADALHGGYDSVITIGGEQSNHCRATAAACRMIGLEPHLILRTRRADEVESSKRNSNQDSFGYVGNILFDRLVGAKIHTCTPGEYGRFGSLALIRSLCKDLEEDVCITEEKDKDKKPRKVYQIPVGGSNGLGTWGYIEAVDEVMHQIRSENQKIDHVVFASGSGGTAAGITLGLALAYLENNDTDNVPNIHAVGVCDDPDYFYNVISNITKEMGLEDVASVLESSSLSSSLMTTTGDNISIETFIRHYLTVHQGKGKGYSVSTTEELDFIVDFAVETGICLDPVYSGKALFRFMEEIKQNPESYKNSRVLFWHTGGSLGNYEKIDALRSKLRLISSVERMDVYRRKEK